MNTQETIDLFDKYVIANYGRLPRVIVKGEGCYLYDADGNKILDMFPGWAVSAIGHCHPKVEACITALDGGVRKAHIIDGRIAHSLLLEIYTEKGIGTQILQN